MAQVYTVAKDKVDDVWDEVGPLLNLAMLKYEDPDYGIDYLKEQVVKGWQHLLIIVVDDKIVGAYTVEIIDYENHRVAFTTCMGGSKVFDKDTVKQNEQWANSQGATKIRAYASESQARLFRRKLGLHPIMSVVEKNI